MEGPIQFLEACRGFWGERDFRRDDPDIYESANVIYLPMIQGDPRASEGRIWGLYDRQGNALPGSMDIPGLRVSGAQPPPVPDRGVNVRHVVRTAPSCRYLYGGAMKLHYGHFFVNTLARLWSFARDDRRNYDKIVFHSFCNPNAWFKRAFIHDIFDALGISRDDVVALSIPTRFERMTISKTSFQEQAFIHRVFAELCNIIGDRVLAGRMPRHNDRPVYLSKTAMTAGVGRIVNESILEKILESEGFDIIFPETMSFADQVMLFSERRHIMGCLGSALHTSIFRPLGARLTIVCPNDRPLSNFALMDEANGTSAQYLFAPGSRFVAEPGSRFLTNLQLAHPERIAADLVGVAGS